MVHLKYKYNLNLNLQKLTIKKTIKLNKFYKYFLRSQNNKIIWISFLFFLSKKKTFSTTGKIHASHSVWKILKIKFENGIPTKNKNVIRVLDGILGVVDIIVD